jgi:hypothetical protein
MTPPTTRPHSPWIRFTWIAFGLALAVAGAFVALAPRLRAWGIAPQIYFLVLFVLGLAAAAFLFGALRSTATFEGTPYGGTLKLGGPVVVFAIVIGGGFYLTKADTSFPLVVRVYGPDGEVIKKGNVTIDFDGDRKGPYPITERGESYFPVVSSAFIGKSVPVRVDDVPGYSSKGFSLTLDTSSVLNVTLDKRPVAPRKVAGLVEDRNGKKVRGARVTLPTLKLHDDSNGDGYFEMVVTTEGPTESLLRVEKAGFQLLEQYVSLGNSELTLVLDPVSSHLVQRAR